MDAAGEIDAISGGMDSVSGSGSGGGGCNPAAVASGGGPAAASGGCNPAAVAGSGIGAARPADTKPSWRVLAAVAQALGQAVTLPDGLDASALEGRGIHGLADACGLGSRVVVLADGWWRTESGPLIAALQAGNQPVALLPGKRGFGGRRGYVLWNPVSGEHLPVTRDVGLSVRPQAVMLYRRFAEGPVTGRRLLAFGLTGSRPRMRRFAGLTALAALPGVFVTMAIGALTDAVIPRADGSGLAMLTAGLLVAALSGACFTLVRSLLVQQIEQQIDLEAQPALFERLMRLPMAVLRRFNSGDLAERVLGLQAAYQGLAAALLTGSAAALMMVLQTGMMGVYGGRLAWFGLAAAAMSGLAAAGCSVWQWRQQRLAAGDGTAEAIVLQLISGIGKLKTAAATGRAHALWLAAYRRQLDAFGRVQRAAGARVRFEAAFMPIATALVYFVAAKAVLHTGPGASGFADASAAGADFEPGLTPGGFLAFSAAFGQVMVGVSGLAASLSTVLRAVPAYRRAMPLLTAVPESAAGRAHPGALSGRIEVRDVSFSYPGMRLPVLQGLSFDVAPGEFLAITGPSGGGKSSILRLLTGLEAADSGDILYDGKPLASLDIAAVRRQLGVVLQDGRVQPATILDNIGGGRAITLEAARDAARQAGLDADIKAMPMGMHTGLTDGGSTLSGGQRQRLLIARALASKPRILLLDEATSALDNHTQAMFADTVASLGLTRIVVAHRLTTIAKAHRVLVIERGRIVQEGRYQDLIARPGLFRDLAMRQRV